MQSRTGGLALLRGAWPKSWRCCAVLSEQLDCVLSGAAIDAVAASCSVSY